MELRPLFPEEGPVRRFVEDLWLPYHRELEATVGSHALAGDVDLVAEETAFRLGRLEEEGYRAWVAVDGEGGITDERATLAGFVTTEPDRSPPVFDRPDRLVIGDIYVKEPYRGTGLARDLMGRAAERAREADCAELALDVDVDNDRAVAFYERLGFEPLRRRLTRPVEGF